MDEKIRTGIIALITALVAFGGSQYLTAEELENTYYCQLTGEIGIFDRLSSSSKTGYYIDSHGNEESESCRKGYTYEPWIPLLEYAESQGLSVQDLINTSPSSMAERAEVCGRQGCFFCETPIKAYSECDGTTDRAGEIVLP